jgi:hypothetical protein
MLYVVVKALCYKPKGLIPDEYLILSALGPAVYWACNRNEYQKH